MRKSSGAINSGRDRDCNPSLVRSPSDLPEDCVDVLGLWEHPHGYEWRISWVQDGEWRGARNIKTDGLVSWIRIPLPERAAIALAHPRGRLRLARASAQLWAYLTEPTEYEPADLSFEAALKFLGRCRREGRDMPTIFRKYVLGPFRRNQSGNCRSSQAHSSDP